MRRPACLVLSLVVSCLVPAGSLLASEEENPFDSTGAPASPPYAPDQRLNFESPRPGVTAAAPRRVAVHFRRFEFDLVPSSLELWIDGVEHTESLRFWDDRAWIDTPDPFWTSGAHSVSASVKDVTGGTHTETVDFDWKAPASLYPAPLAVSEVSNIFENYQGFLSTPYWHSGVDLRTDDGTPILSCTAGTVVRVVRYRTGENYWEVAVEDPDGYVWQYHHIDQASITVAETDVVAQGDTLGIVEDWESSVNGHLYHHLHVNVTRWLGPGPLDKPYVDGFEYHNPLLFIEQPPGADTVFPTEMKMFFTRNEVDSVWYDVDDPGDPELSGDVDIVARLEDERTMVNGVVGHPYRQGLYDLAWSAEPLDAQCQMAWQPRTPLAKFDKIPGDSLVATQEALLLDVYKRTLYDGGATWTTDFTNASRKFLYTMTNGFFGTIDADKGYWNTDAQSILGVKFPDGEYVVRLYASDFDGNELVVPVHVFLDNGLSFTGQCPEWIGNGMGGGPPGGGLVLQRSGLPDASTDFGTFPVDFSAGVEEGSARATIAYGDWPVWYFDYPGLNQRIAIGVLSADSVDVEYVPYLGDVILEIPAEAQVLPYAPAKPGEAGAQVGTFDPAAPSVNPVTLRLSTRLARNEWTSAAAVGEPKDPHGTTFTLVEAEAFDVDGETVLFRTMDGGLPVAWDIGSVSVPEDPAPAPRPLLRVFPNPFGAELEVQLSLPAPTEVRVEILSVTGRRVRLLHEGRIAAGTERWKWDGLDDGGRRAAQGVYFVRVRGADVHEVVKSIRLR